MAREKLTIGDVFGELTSTVADAFKGAPKQRQISLVEEKVSLTLSGGYQRRTRSLNITESDIPNYERGGIDYDHSEKKAAKFSLLESLVCPPLLWICEGTSSGVSFLSRKFRGAADHIMERVEAHFDDRDKLQSQRPDARSHDRDFRLPSSHRENVRVGVGESGLRRHRLTFRANDDGFKPER
ncbi:MAG: hypothetical protein DYH13_11120 [Alphaproteobacteria bacterium PRO2]|nr:hypothetical protein [Alphaproteobacteria bacterium PRO2]